MNKYIIPLKVIAPPGVAVSVTEVGIEIVDLRVAICGPGAEVKLDLFCVCIRRLFFTHIDIVRL